MLSTLILFGFNKKSVLPSNWYSHTDRQMDRQTDRWTERRTDRQDRL